MKTEYTAVAFALKVICSADEAWSDTAMLSQLVRSHIQPLVIQMLVRKHAVVIKEAVNVHSNINDMNVIYCH